MRTTLGKLAAAAAIVLLPSAALAQESEQPITTPPPAASDVKYPNGSATFRLHAGTLADGNIKFTELPEAGAVVNLDATTSLNLSANILSDPGQNLLSRRGGEQILIGDAFVKTQAGPVTLKAGQFEFFLPGNFGTTWLQPAMAKPLVAPQILEEGRFPYSIAQVKGVQAEHTVALKDNASLHFSGGAGVRELNGRSPVQAFGYAQYTKPHERGTTSFNLELMTRDAGGAVMEQSAFTAVQTSYRLNETFNLRGDAEVGIVHNLGGTPGRDGAYAGLRAFVDATINDKLNAYGGAGAFHLPGGDEYLSAEAGAAYRIAPNLHGHAGAGYATGGFAKGVSTTAGVTYTFNF